MRARWVCTADGLAENHARVVFAAGRGPFATSGSRPACYFWSKTRDETTKRRGRMTASETAQLAEAD